VRGPAAGRGSSRAGTLYKRCVQAGTPAHSPATGSKRSIIVSVACSLCIQREGGGPFLQSARYPSLDALERCRPDPPAAPRNFSHLCPIVLTCRRATTAAARRWRSPQADCPRATGDAPPARLLFPVAGSSYFAGAYRPVIAQRGGRFPVRRSPPARRPPAASRAPRRLRAGIGQQVVDMGEFGAQGFQV
jgi:hypothetical protein